MNKLIIVGLLPILMMACSSTPMDSYAFKNRYNAAISDVKEGKHEAAITALEALANEADTPSEQEQIDFGLAYAYYQNKDYDKSIERTEIFIRQHPKHSKLEYAYYLRSLAITAKGDQQMFNLLENIATNKNISPEILREGYDNFAKTLQHYPKGDYAEDVIRQMTRIRKKLAEFELNIVRSDFTQEQYDEAARRAKYVIEYYDDTPAHMTGLELLVKIYKAQGKTKMAEETSKTLLQLQEVN
ncbi:MAG: outer membrane protein assembly factor BamD [Gammaproteobacteria bacterium]|nr:outer membrane protein assembly factor BamD [Gammaproteobacteria bacterium]